MSNRTANYAAFYVKEPFNASNLGAHATPDFVYYNQLKAWKSQDSSFPFIDAHDKTYNVRDDSSWETLKQRLHQRLNMSKNIIFFYLKPQRIVMLFQKKLTMESILKGFQLSLSTQIIERSQILCN